MQLLTSISTYILVLSFFTNCSSAQKFQEKSPITFGDVTSQKWISGVKGGGSGINLFIPVLEAMPTTVKLDSVYFRGNVAKLELIEGDTIVYVGRYETEFNKNRDIVMSSDSNEEYGNESPKLDKKLPFDLKDSECVISYIQNGEIKYFKIENITEKSPQNYPSAPPNKHE